MSILRGQVERGVLVGVGLAHLSAGLKEDLGDLQVQGFNLGDRL